MIPSKRLKRRLCRRFEVESPNGTKLNFRESGSFPLELSVKIEALSRARIQLQLFSNSVDRLLAPLTERKGLDLPERATNDSWKFASAAGAVRTSFRLETSSLNALQISSSH
jgi:hypothetical protein